MNDKVDFSNKTIRIELLDNAGQKPYDTDSINSNKPILQSIQVKPNYGRNTRSNTSKCGCKHNMHVTKTGERMPHSLEAEHCSTSPAE